MALPADVLVLMLALVAILVVGIVVVVILLIRRRPSADLSVAIGQIHGRLAQIEDISRDVSDLSDIFLVPRTRGGVGEVFLQRLLADWLPSSAYSLQHGFATGSRVDAVIRLGSSLVPIDAKFPLEAVRRAIASSRPELPSDVRSALRRHAHDIASRYIQPDEGTMEFALMYLPSEKVYHYLFVEHEDAGLFQQVLADRVVPVSPGNLFLYLHTVAFGLKGLAVPARYREMVSLIKQLRQDFDRLDQAIGTLGTHIRNSSKALDSLRSQAARVDERLSRLDDG